MRALMTIAVLALGSTSLAAQQTERFDWSGTVARGRTLEIVGVNGDITVTRGSGTAVVRADKRGRRSNPADVRVEVVEHGDGVTICAVYPSDEPGRPNECRPGGKGRNSSKNNDVRVDFMVEVPAGVHVALRTVNGDVSARDVDGNMAASTVNGEIEVEGSGHAEASTVNGSIRVGMGRADWSGEASFSTVNGSITLEIADAASFDLVATTVNGAIQSDFPVTMTGRFGPRRVTGTVGNGGRDLKLSTVNGGITLRKKP